MIVRCVSLILTSLLLFPINSGLASQLAIVIDDFGYRQQNEQKIISLSPNITIAVLPYSPHAKRMSTLANKQGNEVIIHLPMAPLSKQPLEKETLFPYMGEEEVNQIIANAVERVPYAIGVNNHMGSLMTSDLKGMEHVMKALNQYSFFYLDSKTIGKTQVMNAAQNYNIPVLVRDVFLDDKQNEIAIAHQFDIAIELARKKGQAIVIGHPYPQTVNVLTKKLSELPSDIQLVKLSQLIHPESLPEKPTLTFKDIYKIFEKIGYEIYYLTIMQQ